MKNLYKIDREIAIDDLVDYWHNTNDLSYHQHGDDNSVLSLREFLNFNKSDYGNYVINNILPKNIDEILFNHIIKLPCTENLDDKSEWNHRYSKELEELMLDIREVANFYNLYQYQGIIYCFCTWGDGSYEMIPLIEGESKRISISMDDLEIPYKQDLFGLFKSKLND